MQSVVAYNVVVSVNRDADNTKVTAAFRKIVLKVHPGKGGKWEDSQALQSAKSAWDKAQRDATSNKKKGGRPKEAHNQGGRKAPKQTGETIATDLADPAQNKKQYRIQSYFVLLTQLDMCSAKLQSSFGGIASARQNRPGDFRHLTQDVNR